MTNKVSKESIQVWLEHPVSQAYFESLRREHHDTEAVQDISKMNHLTGEEAIRFIAQCTGCMIGLHTAIEAEYVINKQDLLITEEQS